MSNSATTTQWSPSSSSSKGSKHDYDDSSRPPDFISMTTATEKININDNDNCTIASDVSVECDTNADQPTTPLDTEATETNDAASETKVQQPPTVPPSSPPATPNQVSSTLPSATSSPACDSSSSSPTSGAIKRRSSKERKQNALKDAEVVKRLKEICGNVDPTALYTDMVKIGQG
jgi:p21-activated kinase 1